MRRVQRVPAMLQATPHKRVKVFKKDGCFLCGREELNSRKRRSLEQLELQQKVSELLPLSPEELTSNSHRYVCETPCFRDIDKFFKQKASCEMLKSSIVQRFEEGAEQRIKRCLPSDVEPHQSPELKKHSQATGLPRGQSSSSSPAPTCEPVCIGDDKPAPQAMVQQFLGPWPLSSVANMISPGYIFCPKPPLNSTVQTVKDSNIVDDDCSDFKVTINYSNGKKSKELPEDLTKLGKALARGSDSKSIVTAMLSSSELRQSVEEHICNVISNEAKTLCSTKSPSCLRTPTKESMLTFSWSAAGNEIQEKAPLLHRVLQAAAIPKFMQGQSDAARYPGICLAAGILLKLRDPAMSLIPYVMSLMLKAAGITKKGFIRLNHLGLTMSPKSINTALDKVGEDYSIKLIQKKEEVSDYLKKEIELKHQEKELNTRITELEKTIKASNDITSNADLVGDLNESRLTLQNVKDKLDELAQSRPSSFSIVLDNLDIRIEASEMTSENQNKDHHWCNHNAVFDRVNPVELSDEKPLADIQDVPNRAILPLLEDHKKIMDDFVILVSRVFVENFSSFDIFKDIVPNHIKHKYSEEMKKATNKVHLGMLFKNENLGEDMIDILRILHEWVPHTNDNGVEIFDRVPVVGDQLTLERGLEGQFSVSNAYSKRGRLEGLFFQLADWHLENKFLALIFGRVYSGSSACDRTSLFALRNLVNWRDVVTDAEHKPAPCKRFLNLVLDAQIIAAGLKFFGMKNVNDKPTENGFSESMKERIKPVKLKYLQTTVLKFICTYIVDIELYKTHFSNIDLLQEWEDHEANQVVNLDGRYPCRFSGCQASFRYDGRSRRQHELAHDPPPEIKEVPQLARTLPDQMDQNGVVQDDVLNYHCSIMNMALLLRNFIDAGREGDGVRILRCIKFFLLHFRQDGSGSVKYALESLYHLFQVFALSTPREAERLTWNRTVNTKGGEGNNVFLDLNLEHDNHSVTELLRALGANVNETSVNRICRAFFLILNLLEKLDCEMHVPKNSAEHTKKNMHGDLMTIVDALVTEDVFTRKLDREPLKLFHNCPRDYLQFLDTSSLFKWINDHKKNIVEGRRPR
ncbi:hypothetical protein ACROYT_G036674 [Oculina patagonica]